MKHKFIFFAVLLTVLAIPYNALAEYDFSAVAPTGQTLYYTIINSNEVSVTYPSSNYSLPYSGFSEPTGNLSIPSTVTDGGTTYSITSIGDYAFSQCYGLTSVSIPNSVTSISEGAFYRNNLTSLTIPNSVISIGNGAFAGSGSLTSIVVSSDNTIFDSRENCNAIIETASNTLICGCANTTIPSSVTMIGDFAFFEIRLTTLTIPISIISIGNSAFSYCENLRWVIIPNSVTSIGEYAFTGCSGLTSISVSSGNPVYDSRENCNAIIETASNTIIFGCVTTTIPNSVTSIGDYAFSYYSDLTTLTIPNSVTSIGNYAFYNCSGMTSLTLPNSVTSIGDYAFSFCSGLTTLTIPNSVISIGEWAFSFCSGLTTLTIGNSLTSISKAAFYYCRNLTTLSIGNSVTTIGNFAFEECNSLSSLTIPSSVTAIGSYAFKGGSNLTEINCLGATAPELWGYSFYNVDNTIPVNIPCGSLASYQPEWSYSFSNFNEILSTYTLDVYSSDDAMGSASITTLPNCDDNTAVIEATANDGYHFDHWSDGSTANPYTVQLTDNTTLIAYFSSNTGIEDIDNSGILVYAKNHQIHIDAAIGETVSVYTIDGRTLAALPKATEHVTIPVTVAGVYLVKIGNYPARKVVVTW